MSVSEYPMRNVPSGDTSLRLRLRNAHAAIFLIMSFVLPAACFTTVGHVSSSVGSVRA